MVASGVFAGVHTLDWAYERQDATGKTFGQELERIGWVGDEEVGSRKMHAFFELHIEQGPILEKEKKTNWSGYSWTRVKLVADNAYRQGEPYWIYAYAHENKCRARNGANYAIGKRHRPS